MIRLDGRMNEAQMSNLLKLMDDLDFTEEQKYQMYFMTFDDTYFVESFMNTCAQLPSGHPTVIKYLKMLEHDIENFSKDVYERFRVEAKHYPDMRKRDTGVIENYTKEVIDRSVENSAAMKPKLKIKLKG